MSKRPKETNVYGSTAEGIADVLDTVIADEPPPTPRAAEIIEKAEHDGPIAPIPGPGDGFPTLPGATGGPDGLANGAAGLAAVTPRESAENAIELLFALVPAGDWQPEDESERDELIRALERVLTIRGWTLALPPEAILIAVAGKYTRKRMAKPAVRARLGPWLQKMPLLGRLMGAPAADDPAPTEGAAEAFQNLPRMTAPHDAR